jgi:hypothetical protein
MGRKWSWPKWTFKYVVASLAVSAFFGLALDCADAATCSTGRLLTGLTVAGSLLILYLLILVERYLRSGREDG